MPSKSRRKQRGGGGAEFADKAYEGTASFGRIMMVFKALMTTLICAIGIFVGVWLIRRKDIYTANATGKVLTSKCVNANNVNTCDVSVEFTGSGKTIKSDPMSLQGNFQTGQSIDVRYDPGNPNNFTVQSLTSKKIGWIVIAICVFILISTWGWFIVVWKNKTAAAISGASDGIGMAYGAFDGNDNDS